MNRLAYMRGITLCLALAASGARAQTLPEGSDSAPMEITTDTRDYCQHLRRQLEARRDPPDEVRVLTAEGWRMCSEGHVIGGLARLRRAVAILRDGTEGR